MPSVAEKDFQVKIRPLLTGIASYVPGLYKFSSRAKSSGGAACGTNSARYCYSVWLRHLVMIYNNGLTTHPDVIAELGPGDSLGIGLAALLSGANKYYAFDAVQYFTNKRNIEIFYELVNLFRNREKIPDENELPHVRPYLNSYVFPSHILTEECLNKALKPNRIESIKNALLNLNNKGESNRNQIVYIYSPRFIDYHKNLKGIFDMIFSQAVLEHVDDLSSVYEAMHFWLKPRGFISHQIDFRSHEISKNWDGHWTYSDFVWNRLIRGKKPYLINREPHATHINLLRKFGFDIVCDMQIKDNSCIQRRRLAPRFKNMSDNDLITVGAFIQATKKQLR